KTVDAVIALDARQQGGMLARALLAGDDAPFRAAAVDVLPELLGEFRLRAHRLERAHVGFDRVHHPRVGRLRYAALERAGAEACHPMREPGRSGAARRGPSGGSGGTASAAHERAPAKRGGDGESRHGRRSITQTPTAAAAAMGVVAVLSPN